MAKERIFLLAIEGGTEPTIEGEHDSYEDMLDQACDVNRRQDRGEDGLFYLRLSAKGELSVHSFVSDELNDDDDED